MSTNASIHRGGNLSRNRTYIVAAGEHDDALKVLQTAKFIGDQREIRENLSLMRNMMVQNACCRRASTRGAFLTLGSISNPEKFYHFEITYSSVTKTEQLKGIIAAFDIEPETVLRKRYYMVYIKEGNQIVDVLNVMETLVSLMEFENIRIFREMRGDVNRQVNCETASISKTVSAAVEQTEDIRYIQGTIGLKGLPEGLQDMARVRLEHPETALRELGEALEPPVGKPRVNHQLRKLSQIAGDMRRQLPGKQYGVYSLMYH